MALSFLTDRHRRYLAGGSVSLLGGTLLGIPAYDIWDDVTNLSWSLVTTVAENVLFLVLAGTLVGGGIWLVRTEWETDVVVTVVKRTLAGTAVIAALMAWAIATQLWAMHALKPYVLSANGVLLGAVTSFGLGVTSVKVAKHRQEAVQNRRLTEHLEALHSYAEDLEGATTRGEAHDIIDDAVQTLVPGVPFRVVIDGDLMVERAASLPAERFSPPAHTASIGERGRIELADEPSEAHEYTTLELLATHLDTTLQRLDRAESLRDERDHLAFVNRTTRHDLLNDLNLVQSRLRFLEEQANLADEQHRDHLSVVVDRIHDMNEFVQTMRTYMESVLNEDHELEPVPIKAVLESEVGSVQQAHPEADIHLESIPEVDVRADELLNAVCRNVLVNAVEHNDESTPRVVVDAEHRDGSLRVRFADNGPGISEEQADAIFDHGERGRESKGSGFGLYLVSDAVDTYGGTVRVEDNEPKGSVFVLDLPLASAETPA